MQEREIRALISAGESETLELKTSVPNPDTIASHRAAFANTEGGILLVGIKELATIVGINPRKSNHAISTALRKIHSDISVDSGTVKMGHADVAYINVRKPPLWWCLPVSSGGCHARYGSNIRPQTADEIKASSLTRSAIENALSETSANSARQSETIDRMSEELRKANSMPRKILIALGGALLGAVAKHSLDIFA